MRKVHGVLVLGNQYLEALVIEKVCDLESRCLAIEKACDLKNLCNQVQVVIASQCNHNLTDAMPGNPRRRMRVEPGMRI